MILKNEHNILTLDQCCLPKKTQCNLISKMQLLTAAFWTANVSQCKRSSCLFLTSFCNVCSFQGNITYGDRCQVEGKVEKLQTIFYRLC